MKRRALHAQEPMAGWSHARLGLPGLEEFRFDTWSIGRADAGVTVIALHGFPQSARCFGEVGRLLAGPGLRVVAPDQRGYSSGARPQDVSAYAVELLAQDVLALADRLQVESFHLVGHDWGAQVGWVLCRDAAPRVQSFTALSVPHPRAYAMAFREDAAQRSAAQYIRTFWQPGVAEDYLLGDDARQLRRLFSGLASPEVEAYVQRMREPGAMAAALNWYRAMQSNGMKFPPTQVPTTYVWGRDDPALRRSAAELCGQNVKADYRFLELDAGHWLPDLASPAVVDAILERVMGG